MLGRYSQLPVVILESWAPTEITEEKLKLWRQKLAPRFDNRSSEGWAKLERQLTTDYWWDFLTNGTKSVHRRTGATPPNGRTYSAVSGVLSPL